MVNEVQHDLESIQQNAETSLPVPMPATEVFGCCRNKLAVLVVAGFVTPKPNPETHIESITIILSLNIKTSRTFFVYILYSGSPAI